MANLLHISFVPADDTTVIFAVAELRKYIEIACGIKSAIIHGRKPEGRFIQLGLGASGELEGEEAYRIDIRPDRILLLGGSPRAVLYAVYTFLEEHVGFRWFYPGEDITPKRSPEFLDLLMQSSSRKQYTPDFDTRMRRYLVYDLGKAGTQLAGAILETIPREADWMAKNRVNVFQFALDHNRHTLDHWKAFRKYIPEFRKRSITLGVGGHCSFMFLGPEEHKNHPDWYPSLDRIASHNDMFCTRNEEAVSHYIGNMKRFLRENPEVEYFAPWPNDNAVWCTCDMCRSLSVADRYLELNNRTFTELKAESPRIRMTHFVYQTHLDPPARVLPEKGLSVTICTWGRDLSVPFSDERTPSEFREALEKWRSITASNGAGLILHEKYARHLGFGPQTLPAPALEQDLRHFKSLRISGLELPMAYMGRWIKGLSYYAIARLLWDTGLSADGIIDDYCSYYYGPIHEHLKKAYEVFSESLHDWRYWSNNSVQCALQLKPGDPFPEWLLTHCRKVLKGARHAERIVRSSFPKVSREAEDFVARARGFITVLEYCQIEFQALEALAEGDLAFRRNDTEHAREFLRKAVHLTRKRNDIAANPELSAFVWDAVGTGPSGVLPLADASEWLRLVQ